MVEQQTELKGYLGARIDKLQSETDDRFAFFAWVAMFYGCLIIWAITK